MYLKIINHYLLFFTFCLLSFFIFRARGVSARLTGFSSGERRKEIHARFRPRVKTLLPRGRGDMFHVFTSTWFRDPCVQSKLCEGEGISDDDVDL